MYLLLLFELCWAHRFVEHALDSVLVLLVRAVDEAITEQVVVDAAVAAHAVRGRARETFHFVLSRWTF